MFPSTNTSNNAFEFLSNKSPSLCDHQITKQDLDPSFFLSFPSPFFDEHEFPVNDILSQDQIMAENHQNFVANHILKDSSDIDTKKGKSTKRGIVDNQVVGQPIIKRRNLGAVPRKRTGKKDRHSKICTAQGIRDRRMRLSLQVARKFFDLQDMLGYDKASKTIEWLFTKSKKAIKELIQEHDPTIQANDKNDNICTSEAKSESFQSECEVVSGIEETSNNVEVKEGIVPTNQMPLCIGTPCETKDHDIKPRNPVTYKANIMKESRDKARARARCRTREKKMMIKGLELTNQLCKSLNPNNDDHKLGSFTKIPFEGLDKESVSMNQENIFSYGADFTSSFEQQLADVGTIEKFLKGSCSNSSRFCPISEYNNNQSYVSVSSCIDSNFMGLIGHLDLMSSSQYTINSLAGSSLNSPFEGVDQKSVSYKQERVSQYGADVGTIEKLLEINSSSSNASNNNSFMGFLGNWDMLNNIDRLNSTSVTDHVSLAAGKPTSI